MSVAEDLASWWNATRPPREPGREVRKVGGNRGPAEPTERTGLADSIADGFRGISPRLGAPTPPTAANGSLRPATATVSAAWTSDDCTRFEAILATL